MKNISNHKRILVGKNCKKKGNCPAIALCNPKYTHNLGAAIRSASCFGVDQIWYSGNRIQIADGERIPREERMKGYANVDLIQYDKFFDVFEPSVQFVGIELVKGAEQLVEFEHPQNAVYVFGPEDGSLNKVQRSKCHRLVAIPTYHCLNLAAAVNVVLYDRLVKGRANGTIPWMHMDDYLSSDRKALKEINI